MNNYICCNYVASILHELIQYDIQSQQEFWKKHYIYYSYVAFYLHEPMHYDFQNQSYSQNQHYIFYNYVASFHHELIQWLSKSIWLTNLAPYISHICSSSWADAVWIISSMWLRKQTLDFSHICCRLWTDNQNQSFSKITFNYEENLDSFENSVTWKNQCSSKFFGPVSK